MTSSPSFTGFSRAGVRFLRDLAKNNDRQWFTPRKNIYLSDDADSLKRVPRGFESYAESPMAKYLRRTSFTVSEKVSNGEVASTDLIRRIVDFAKRTLPLLDYGWNLS